MTPIIIDSSALVALVNPADADHAKAVAISTALGAAARPILVPPEVLAETLNILGKKLTRLFACAVGERLLAGDGLLVFQPTELPTRAALVKWREQPGGVSYIDCTVMVHADQHETGEIFGFDGAFAKNGYRLPDAGKAA